MNDRARRKELVTQYRQTPPEAGVYWIVNTATNKSLIGSTTNLASIRNKMAFARSTNMLGTLDQRLRKDIEAVGLGAFSLEILEVLKVEPEMIAADVRRDLEMLEALWREKIGPAALY